jgi:S-DNA-T family DNA segregation ATPase FtsK/SpoIIIE
MTAQAARTHPAPAAQPHTLWLLVEGRGGPPVEVSARVPPGSRVGDLARALARHVGESSRDRLALPDGQLLDPTAPVVEAPLREGDLLRLVDERYRPEAPSIATLELKIVSGPTAGVRYRLADGVHTLGRGQCDLQVSGDPAVSRLHAQVSVRDGEAFLDEIPGRNGIWAGGRPIAAPYHVRLDEVVAIGRSLVTIAHASPLHRFPGRGGVVLLGDRPPDVPGDLRSSPAPDPCELEDRARLCLPPLWGRRPGEPDFLHLRLGWIDRYDRERAAGEPEPISVELAGHEVLAIAGDEAGRRGLARWLAIQAATLHRPGDLRIAALLSDGRLAEWGWLKWLPHTAAPAGAPRAAHLLVVVDEDDPDLDAVLRWAREQAAGGRVHLLWLAGQAPDGASAAVHLQPAVSGRAHVRVPRQGIDLEGAIPDAVGVEFATRVARHLAGIRETLEDGDRRAPRAGDGRSTHPEGEISVEPLGPLGVVAAEPAAGTTADDGAPTPSSTGRRRTSRELRITVQIEGGPPRDVAVEVDSGKTVADLAGAIAGHLGLQPGPQRTLLARRPGRVLQPGLPVHACGLRTGDVVVLQSGRPDAAPRAHSDQPVQDVDESGLTPFNRPPRMVWRPDALDLRLEPPPPPRPTIGDALRPLLPVGIGLVLGVTLGLVTYLTSHQVGFLLFAALGPMMGIVSAVFPFAEVTGRRRAYKREAADFRARVAALQADIARTQGGEQRELHLAAPEPELLLQWATTLDTRLWERDPASADWLQLRAGLTDRPSRLEVEFAEGGDPDLRSEAEQVLAQHRTLTSVPLLVDLARAGTLGLCGGTDQVESLARWLLLQVATLHSPRDVVIAAVLPDRERDRWEWLGWLPHVHSDTAPLSGRLVVSDAAAADPPDLLKRLLALLDERRNAGGSPQQTTSVVVLVHQGVRLPQGEVSHLLGSGPSQRIHTILLGSRRHLLPRECGALAEVERGQGVLLLHPARGESTTGSSADDVSPSVAAEVSRALAALRDLSARGAQVGVPRSVSLVELLGLRDDPEGVIQASWERDLASGGVGRDLSAPLGVAAGHREFSLSVRRDGPHGLVGGMTGSGKSELLQSLVAALAARHSPEALNFLLVDYKGGAAFKDCVDLPHTVGFVTDLDGRLVNRALTSMRAELARRERLQGEAGVKDLEDFERHHPDLAPPSLVIVVDEFAALASELPDFVEGMVDIAQRGRSLGIHLILATQRPAGVIGPKIRANTPMRLSLRFKDESDSEDVLKTKDAARPGLPPGRTFTVASSGELVEFQAGYAGGHTLADPGPAPIRVRDLDFGGTPAAAPGGGTSSARVESDLLRLVRAMGEVNRRLDLSPPHRPWLPALPARLPLATLPAVQGWRGPTAMIGLLDEPRTQSQTSLSFPLEEEGTLLVYGSSGAGKTTLLRTLAISAAESTPPSGLHLYVLDFATRLLGSLEALPHCGGVIMGDESARAAKLMTWLRREAERRKALLGAAAAPSLSDYLASEPEVRLPYVLVLLDGYAGFVSALENVEMGAPVDTLRGLLTTGRPLGMAFAITADRADRGVANLRVNRRVVLSSSQDDYATFALPRALYEAGELEPGRGYTFTANPRGALEVQCALVGADPGGRAQSAAVAAIGARLARQHEPAAVPRIQTLPAALRPDELPAPATSLEAVVGLRENDDDTLGPARVDLATGGHFVITGPAGSGRTNTLGAFAASLGAADEPPIAHLLTFRRQSWLAGESLWTSIALGEEECRKLLERLATAARESPSEVGLNVLFVDDGEELVSGMGIPELTWLAQEGAERGFRVVMAVDSQKELTCKGWITQAARVRHGIVFNPGFGADGSIAGHPTVSLPPSKAAMPKGRGYLVRAGAYETVQVARLRG